MSLGELIELEELEERIELADSLSPRAPRLERVNALRISPGKFPELWNRVRIIRLLGDTMKDPQLIEETGEGHDFHPCSHAQPTWCDLCGDFIWGVYKQSLRCASECWSLCVLCAIHEKCVVSDYSIHIKASKFKIYSKVSYRHKFTTTYNLTLAIIPTLFIK